MTQEPSRIARRANVLVVDDEPLIRWSVSETLRHEGFAVVEAGDARSAIGAVASAPTPFGVVILDVKLPDSHDLSLLTRVHDAMSSARIIVMTAHGTPELERDALQRGAFCVMNKPFGMADLAEKVAQANDARRLAS
jgi:DNA-binding NtrC family response regulator